MRAAVDAVLPARHVARQRHVDLAVVGNAVAAALAGVGVQRHARRRHRRIHRDRAQARHGAHVAGNVGLLNLHEAGGVDVRRQREARAAARRPVRAAVDAELPARHVARQRHVDLAVVGNAVAAALAGVGVQRHARRRHRRIHRDRAQARHGAHVAGNVGLLNLHEAGGVDVRRQREARAAARRPVLAAVDAELPARHVARQRHVDLAVVGNAVAAALAGVGVQRHARRRHRRIHRDRAQARHGAHVAGNVGLLNLHEAGGVDVRRQREARAAARRPVRAAVRAELPARHVARQRHVDLAVVGNAVAAALAGVGVQRHARRRHRRIHRDRAQARHGAHVAGNVGLLNLHEAGGVNVRRQREARAAARRPVRAAVRAELPARHVARQRHVDLAVVGNAVAAALAGVGVQRHARRRHRRIHRDRAQARHGAHVAGNVGLLNLHERRRRKRSATA